MPHFAPDERPDLAAHHFTLCERTRPCKVSIAQNHNLIRSRESRDRDDVVSFIVSDGARFAFGLISGHIFIEVDHCIAIVRKLQRVRRGYCVFRDLTASFNRFYIFRGAYFFVILSKRR